MPAPSDLDLDFEGQEPTERGKFIMGLFPYALPVPVELYDHEEYNITRLQTFLMISNKLGQHEEFKALNDIEQENLVVMIENGCKNETVLVANRNNIQSKWTPTFKKIYSCVCYRIVVILDVKEPSSKRVIQMLIDNTLDPQKIAHMSTEDLTGKFDEYVQRRKNVSADVRKKSNLYTCNRCKSNDVYIEAIQTRSADEPITLFIECAVCNKKWKK